MNAVAICSPACNLLIGPIDGVNPHKILEIPDNAEGRENLPAYQKLKSAVLDRILQKGVSDRSSLFASKHSFVSPDLLGQTLYSKKPPWLAVTSTTRSMVEPIE